VTEPPETSDDQPAEPAPYPPPLTQPLPYEAPPPTQPLPYAGPPMPPGGWVDLSQQQPSGWQQTYQGGWEQLGPPLPKPPTRRRRGALIAAVAAVAVIGGGAATVVAVSDSQSGFKGAASPRAAVNSLVDDLNQADVLGILDHLVPAERSALVGPLTEQISQAKRLHILNGSADPSRLSGVNVTAKGITYDQPADDVVNDHVRVVKVVGGTISINADLGKVPFTKAFLSEVFPGGVVPSTAKSAGTVDIAEQARENGPLRIATQKVGGRWYPSLLYTFADAAVRDAGVDNPTAADYVAPKGAPTPEEAVKQAIVAISTQDYRRLIELAAPDELQVVHDYGGVILANSHRGAAPPFTVKDLQLTSRKVSGATRVTLKSVTVGVEGHRTTVTVSGECLEITYDGDHRKLCADQVVNGLNGGPLRNKPLTPAESAALGRLVAGVISSGWDVTSSEGQWYVAGLRSYLDGINALLELLHDDDLLVLLNLLHR
jgi:hypothetical protein